MAALSDILAPSIVTGIYSRIKPSGDALQKKRGMWPGSMISGEGGILPGPRVSQHEDCVESRAYSYDIFDHVRSIGKFRKPATGPSKIALNPTGRQTVTIHRSYEKIELSYELIANIRQLGQNAGTRDRMGARYLDAQLRELKQRQVNAREFFLAALLTQGTCAFQFDGDDEIPVLSLGANQGYVTDWLIPPGNKSVYSGAFVAGLNPTGTGNIITAAWNVAATNIPGNLDAINIAFQQLVGAPLSICICDSIVWNSILSNTSLQAEGGSVNPVLTEYDMESMRGPDGNLIGIFVARLRARPWIEWWVIDTGLEVAGVYTKWWNNSCTFLVDPDQTYLKIIEGGEPVKEQPWAAAQWRQGLYSWLREWDEPARVEAHALNNFTLELPVPKGVMISRVQ